MNPYIPFTKTFYSRKIFGYFINYCTNSRGNKFYCLTHSIRIIESNKVIYFKDELVSKSEISRIITFKKENVVISLAPQHVKSSFAIPPVDPMHPIIEDMEPDRSIDEITLKRSQKVHKSTIPNDYLIYL